MALFEQQTQRSGDAGTRALTVTSVGTEFVIAEVADQPSVSRVPEDGLGERIVHRRVESIAGQPRIGTLPDLADGVRLGVDRSDPRAELLAAAQRS